VCSELLGAATLNDVDDLAGHVAAEANHCEEPRVRRALEAVYDRLAHIEARFTDEEEGPVAVIEAAGPFAAKQGQYLAFHLLLHQDSRYATRRGRLSTVFPRDTTRAFGDDVVSGAADHRFRASTSALDW
jgi:hypothetical protein